MRSATYVSRRVFGASAKSADLVSLMFLLHVLRVLGIGSKAGGVMDTYVRHIQVHSSEREKHRILSKGEGT